MKQYIFNHTNEETALVINDYPYGFRLRTQIRYWIESTPKKGDRFCSQTLNPKNGRWNAAKKSTYYAIGAMFKDEMAHIHWDVLSSYDNSIKTQAFIDEIGGLDKLNSLQRSMYNQLMGINEVKTDEFSGKVKKDYSVKWEKNHKGEKYHEVKITFDRLDGVSLKDIFLAMKGLNQERLNECFAGYDSPNFGHTEGFARICVRGGTMLTFVHKAQYTEWLASDFNTELEDKEA